MSGPMAIEDLSVPTPDGRSLFAQRLGTGGPTVVFEAGMGFSRNCWGAVIPLVAEHTTVVAYDRSGLGRSGPASGNRDLAHLTADLDALLDGLGDRRFVLVGHSWGGPIVRSAAAATPWRIAGVVVVDQTDERCDAVFSESFARRERMGVRFIPLMTRLGLIKAVVRRQSKHLPEPWASQLRAEDGISATVAEQVAELRTSTADLRRLRDEPLTLPDVPFTVISGTRAGASEKQWRAELVEAHRAGAEAQPQGRHVRAERSSHYIPFTEPALIADEVLRIVDAARS